MPLTINFAADKLPEKGTLIITATDGGKLGLLGKALDKKTGGAIAKAIKIKKFKGKPASMFALLAPAKTELDRIVVLGVGDGKKLSALDAEKMGGTALGAVEKADGVVTFLLEPMGNKDVSDGEIAARAATGVARGCHFDSVTVLTQQCSVTVYRHAALMKILAWIAPRCGDDTPEPRTPDAGQCMRLS